MVLEASPDSSTLVRAAVASLLYLHIGGGAVGLLSGAGALCFRKGSRLHRIFGNVFFVSMLVAALIGAAVSPFLDPPQWGNVSAGLFTVYLIATGWTTAKHESRNLRFEIAACAVAFCVFAYSVLIALYSLAHPGTIEILPMPTLAFATLVLLAAIGDLKSIFRGRLTGMQRVTRHLWRMCYGLATAVTSFFLGQAQLFPESARNSGVLFLPLIAVFAVMIYWLIRVRFPKHSQFAAARAK